MTRTSDPSTPRSPSCRASVAVAGALALAAALLAFDGVAPTPLQAQQATVDPALYENLNYRMVGPTRGGRVTAVAGHRAHPSTFYMGSTGGGVWKTEDWGETWRPIMDDILPTGSIGSVRVAPSDPDRVYVGTGSDGIRSNLVVGRGAFRSDDAGRTWTAIGLEETGQIGAMEVHPDDPDVVFAAALGDPFGRNPERGIFRSRDAGENWEKVLFTSDSVGGIDVEFHPTDPNILYASMWRGERKPWTIVSGMEEAGREDGIWRSGDGGDTWSYVPLDLPSGLIGKIDFAVTPADPDRVYAVVETTEPDEGLYRSDDAGRTWRLVSNHGPLMDRPFYYTNVDADPTDADVVYVSATQFWKSTDGGEAWERRSTPHGDNHDLWINPDDPRIMVQSNDGGANVTRDGGASWSTQMNQPTAELYQVDVDDQFPYWLYAGQQDNSTLMLPSHPPAEASVVGPDGWLKDVGGCETGPVVPRPGDPTVVYANCKGRFGRYSHLTGQEQQYYVGAVNMYGTNPGELPYRFQRTVPIEVSPQDPNTVYHGSQFVHRTTNGGRDWETISPDLTAFRPERQVISGAPITRDITGEEHYSTLYVIEASPHDAQVIWTGANDGPVHVTTDGGENWRDVTPPDMPPEGRMNAIEISPHDPDKVYVAGYRFLLGDWAPYLYRTEDGGDSWTRLADGTNGIPADWPVRVVREDPEVEGVLYAGTEFGMFVSFDDGRTWQDFRLDMPATPITDIQVKEGDLVVSTMGRSFWILDDLSPLRQAREAQAASAPFLYQPRDAYRLRSRGGGPGDGPALTPEYPEAGVLLHYRLPDAASSVELEILDAEGEPVRRYASAEGRGRSAPSTAPGTHRFVWDYSTQGPEGERGPMAVPGRYSVRMTVDGAASTRDFELRIDPRVAADGVTVADLQAQHDLAWQLIALLDRAEETASEVERSLGDATAAQIRERLDRLQDRLVTADGGSYPQPMLIDQIEYLYGMISRADQPPGGEAYKRYEELKVQLDEIVRELSEVRRVIT